MKTVVPTVPSLKIQKKQKLSLAADRPVGPQVVGALGETGGPCLSPDLPWFGKVSWYFSVNLSR